MDFEKDNWGFEGKFTAKKVSSFDLQEAQHVCEAGDEAMPTIFVKVAELARESVEAKRQHVELSKRDTDTEANLLKACAIVACCASNLQK